MKILYTRENRYLVNNIQNIIENNGIATMLKNEFAAGAVGDLVPHETWLELWVVDDSDYDRAMTLVNDAINDDQNSSWVCSNCKEVNASSFEFCWKCQTSHD